MKFVELRLEDGEECFCMNVDAIAYTKVNKSKAADVEIFLRGGFNITAFVVGKDADISARCNGIEALVGTKGVK